MSSKVETQIVCYVPEYLRNPKSYEDMYKNVELIMRPIDERLDYNRQKGIVFTDSISETSNLITDCRRITTGIRSFYHSRIGFYNVSQTLMSRMFGIMMVSGVPCMIGDDSGAGHSFPAPDRRTMHNAWLLHCLKSGFILPKCTYIMDSDYYRLVLYPYHRNVTSKIDKIGIVIPMGGGKSTIVKRINSSKVVDIDDAISRHKILHSKMVKDAITTNSWSDYNVWYDGMLQRFAKDSGADIFLVHSEHAAIAMGCNIIVPVKLSSEQHIKAKMSLWDPEGAFTEVQLRNLTAQSWDDVTTNNIFGCHNDIYRFVRRIYKTSNGKGQYGLNQPVVYNLKHYICEEHNRIYTRGKDDSVELNRLSRSMMNWSRGILTIPMPVNCPKFNIFGASAATASSVSRWASIFEMDDLHYKHIARFSPALLVCRIAQAFGIIKEHIDVTRNISGNITKLTIGSYHVNPSGHVVNVLLQILKNKGEQLSTPYGCQVDVARFLANYVKNMHNKHYPSLEPTFSKYAWHSWVETIAGCIGAYSLYLGAKKRGIKFSAPSIIIFRRCLTILITSSIRYMHNPRMTYAADRGSLRDHDQRYTV